MFSYLIFISPELGTGAGKGEVGMGNWEWESGNKRTVVTHLRIKRPRHDATNR